MAPPWERFADPTAAPAPDVAVTAAPVSVANPDAPPLPTGPWAKWQDKSVDIETGAPAEVRLQVGSSRDEDKLANIRRHYPDAEPYGGSRNFIFSDPTTGRPTLYNPPGLDTGDLFAIAREATQFTGGALGAAAGGVVAGPPGAIAGAGLGEATGGALFDVSANIGGRIDTRTAGERMTEATIDAVLGAAGQGAGQAIGAGAKAVLSADRAVVARTVQAFERLGIVPTSDMVGSGTTKILFRGLEQSPLGGGWIVSAARKVVEDAGQAADNIEAQIGRSLTPQGAGQVIRESASNRMAVFRDQEELLYESAFRGIGPQTPVVPTQVATMRQAMEAEIRQAPESLEPVLGPAIRLLASMEADAVAAGGGIPFEALRTIRTSVGKRIEMSDIPGSTTLQNAALKRAYGAITEDMSAAAQASNPAAARQLQVADRYVRSFIGTTQETLAKVQRFETDERAFDFAMSAAKDGGTALGRLRRSFSADQWDTVASSVFHQLGLARAGAQDASGDVFSPSVFLTNWTKLAPEAKAALFGGQRYAGVRAALDDLATVAESVKTSESFRNHSGTGKTVFLANAFAALSTGTSGMIMQSPGQLTASAISTVTPIAAARLLSSEKFVRWLASPPAAGARSYPAHFARLAEITAQDPSLQEAVGEFVRTMAGRPQKPAEAASSPPR